MLFYEVGILIPLSDTRLEETSCVIVLLLVELKEKRVAAWQLIKEKKWGSEGKNNRFPFPTQQLSINSVDS